MSAIGTGETIHAAARGENIVAIYINNAIYGMTGGQMAPDYPAGYEDRDDSLTAVIPG